MNLEDIKKLRVQINTDLAVMHPDIHTGINTIKNIVLGYLAWKSNETIIGKNKICIKVVEKTDDTRLMCILKVTIRHHKSGLTADVKYIKTIYPDGSKLSISNIGKMSRIETNDKE